LDADDEAALVQRARAGDAQAFEQLVRGGQSRVRQQLRRLAHGDAALADDLAQEAFVQAWRQLPAFRFEARFSTWLHRVAYTTFLMHLRRRRDEPMPPLAVPEQESARTDPALRLDVARAVDGLPEHERVAIQHCYGLDLSHEEAAAVLGLPLGTLKSHVARAKAHLRLRLAAWQPE
jgi:RNA polymerase sigma-70 factor (ECF subfamily)